MGKHPAIAPSSDLFSGSERFGDRESFITTRNTFPEKYRNRYLIADWTNNCIFLYNPKWDGALQVPAETKRKIVDGGVTRAGDLGYKGAKGRSLFRPTDIDVGPDGALYMAGWGSVYGTKYVPKEKWTAEENAKYQGRVFRLRHKNPLTPRKKWDTTKRKTPIQKWSFNQLMEDMGHQVQVWRVNAQDEFVRRGSKASSELLKAIRSGKSFRKPSNLVCLGGRTDWQSKRNGTWRHQKTCSRKLSLESADSSHSYTGREPSNRFPSDSG